MIRRQRISQTMSLHLFRFEPLPPDKLDTQVPELQCGVGIQFFTSLHRRRGGWVANHALQRRFSVPPSREIRTRVVRSTVPVGG